MRFGQCRVNLFEVPAIHSYRQSPVQPWREHIGKLNPAHSSFFWSSRIRFVGSFNGKLSNLHVGSNPEVDSSAAGFRTLRLALVQLTKRSRSGLKVRQAPLD